MHRRQSITIFIWQHSLRWPVSSSIFRYHQTWKYVSKLLTIYLTVVIERCCFYRSCQSIFRTWWWKLWKTVNGACDCLVFNLTALSKPWTYLITANLEAKSVTGCIFTCRCQSIFLHMTRLWNTLNDSSNQAIWKTLLIIYEKKGWI